MGSKNIFICNKGEGMVVVGEVREEGSGKDLDLDTSSDGLILSDNP
jgi:hypothetical protein